MFCVDNIKHQEKRSFWIKRIYKSDHGSLLNIPKKLSQELQLENHSYMKLYFDKANKMILLSKLNEDE
jgi:hypothetical protein